MKVHTFTIIPKEEGSELVHEEQEVFDLSTLTNVFNGTIALADGRWYECECMGNRRRTNVITSEIPIDEVPKSVRAWALILT